MSKSPFFVKLQHFVPQILLTRLSGYLANCKIKWIKNCLIYAFLKRHPVDLEEAMLSSPEQYESFHAFFTRALKPKARKFDWSSEIICSPADGIVSQYGAITDSQLIQAKGKYYSLDELIGHHLLGTHSFNSGSFLTIYLSPKHYHRVHMPIDGTLTRLDYYPGRLFSVNQTTAEHVDGLFTKNERVVLHFMTAHGQLAVCMVGAMLVGNIVTSFTGSLSWRRTFNEPLSICYPNTDSQRIFVQKGEEIGYFTLGSTVILIDENNVFNQPEFGLNQELKLGQKIGSYI